MLMGDFNVNAKLGCEVNFNLGWCHWQMRSPNTNNWQWHSAAQRLHGQQSFDTFDLPWGSTCLGYAALQNKFHRKALWEAADAIMRRTLVGAVRREPIPKVRIRILLCGVRIVSWPACEWLLEVSSAILYMTWPSASSLINLSGVVAEDIKQWNTIYQRYKEAPSALHKCPIKKYALAFWHIMG